MIHMQEGIIAESMFTFIICHSAGPRKGSQKAIGKGITLGASHRDVSAAVRVEVNLIR